MEASQAQMLLQRTQESLLAALQLQEDHRRTNAQLRSELAQLRNQVHGTNNTQGHSSNVERVAAASPAEVFLGSDLPVRKAAPASAASVAPMYVSARTAEDPVMLIEGNLPAGLMVGSDSLELVQSRTRINSHELLELSAADTPSVPSSSGSRGGGGFLCCIAPSVAEPLNLQGGRGALEVVWRRGITERLQFEPATEQGRQALLQLSKAWLQGQEQPEAGGAMGARGSPLAIPRHLVPSSSATLQLQGGPSDLMDAPHLAALASAVPALERLQAWQLAFSTKKHGMSLATLYRKSSAALPTLLVVRDMAGYLFGCYSTDGWRVSPRFYGTGETRVFQLEPHRLVYPWLTTSQERNDYFQLASPQRLALGGTGGFAICLDEELNQGSSSRCGTFGSPGLASREEFSVQHVEVWQMMRK